MLPDLTNLNLYCNIQTAGSELTFNQTSAGSRIVWGTFFVTLWVMLLTMFIPSSLHCTHQFLKNASSSFVSLCHKELRQLWRQKGVKVITSKVYLMKWPVSWWRVSLLGQHCTHLYKCVFQLFVAYFFKWWVVFLTMCHFLHNIKYNVIHFLGKLLGK